MKTFLFLILILYCSSATEYFIQTVHNLQFQKTEKIYEPEAGLCLDVESFKKDEKFYLQMISKSGSINKTVFYEFIDEACPQNYIFNPENTTLQEKKTSSSIEKSNEFSLEYEFKTIKSKNIFVIYTGYTGEELSVVFSSIKITTAIYIILGILAGVIVVCIILCCCCYCCCKKKQKQILTNDYQTSFAGPILT
jgi:hypothetical protein